MRSKSANSPAHSPSPDGVTPQVLVPTRSALDIGNNGYIGDIEEDGGCDPIEQALLAEQEENRKLREDNLQAREHNRILVNRLQNAGESVSPQAGESELLIPEISRDLLDNLVRENLRLKRDMMTRPTTLNSSQLEQVCQERDQLASQLREVQSVLGASSDKKDAEIHRLSSELADARTETQELAAQCRQLVQQQDENKRSHLITENIQKMSLENGNASLSVVQLKQQNNELQSQLLQLRTEFQEVVGSNKQWQMYDKQREEHIHRLTAEKQDLKIQLARGGAVGFPQQEMSMRKLQESENERQHLLACNQAMEHRIQHLERAINTTPSQEERERIHVLESQVQVFKEDFHQERNDREKAQTRAAKLEDENSLLKQQLDQFQTTHMDFLAQRRSNTMQRYREEYERQRNMPTNVYHGGLVSHGPTYGQVVADGSDTEDQDILDVPMVRSPEDSSLPAQQSTLECPKCHQQFPVDDPMQFLDHNDECNS